jgi:aminomethyltransferase
VRAGVGLFALPERGVVSVVGADRGRWLNGMLSNEVAALEPGLSNSGCYAVLLTPQGRIVSDLHVLQRGDAYWLETAVAAIPAAMTHLDRLLIADDVQLEDASAQWARFALEGPRSLETLLRAADGGGEGLGPDCATDIEIGGVAVVVAAFGFSGEQARQLFVPADRVQPVCEALRAAAVQDGDEALVEADSGALEILRIEAGTPLVGSELAEDTLPDEARIGHAISTSKGCYTGQEVVARLRSHGGVKHLLVGLRPVPPEDAGSASLPEPGTMLVRASDTKRTGELTSRCVSPAVGPIALAFVRRDDAEPGTRLRVDSSASSDSAAGGELEVVALPFLDVPAPPAGAAQ